MAQEEVKLFRNWSSPYALRIVWALKIKGIEFHTVFENLGSKSPLLLQYNPVHKKVPVLVHNGKPICESLIILEYIDETWKENPLLPEDPLDKATARFVFEDLKSKSPSLLQYNPIHKKVPLLIHNGKPICESLVILEYIEETGKKNPLLPDDLSQMQLLPSIVSAFFYSKGRSKRKLKFKPRKTLNLMQLSELLMLKVESVCRSLSWVVINPTYSNVTIKALFQLNCDPCFI